MAKPPKVQEDVVERIREAAESGRVAFAATDEVDVLEPYIRKIVRACAVAMGEDPDTFEPWVSDESCVGDFGPFGEGDKARDAFFKRVGDELGMEVTRHNSSIIELAKKMMN